MKFPFALPLAIAALLAPHLEAEAAKFRRRNFADPAHLHGAEPGEAPKLIPAAWGHAPPGR